MLPDFSYVERVILVIVIMIQPGAKYNGSSSKEIDRNETRKVLGLTFADESLEGLQAYSIVGCTWGKTELVLAQGAKRDVGTTASID